MSNTDIRELFFEIKFELSCGRTVEVTAFSFGATYAVIMEGWPRESTTQQILEWHIQRAVHQMPSEMPTFVIPPELKAVPKEILDAHTKSLRGLQQLFVQPPAATLPPVRCLAELRSDPYDPGHSGSHLRVLWFQRPFFDQPLAAIFPQALRDIPWAEKARDFDD